MKPQTLLKSVIISLLLFLSYFNYSFAQVEQPLWPNGIENNPVKYSEEKMRTSDVRVSSISKQNRVFSCVSNPVYTIVKPEKPNGVGIVICPGGGFRDVWFDREGMDFALFLAKQGVTSLVLKYRTFNRDNLSTGVVYEDYIYHVYADAKQAIYMLRKQSKELGLDTAKIGISGFSAGGALAIGTALEIGDDKLPPYANQLKYKTLPSFVCPVYPGIHPDFIKAIETKSYVPPMFIINGNEDNLTPAATCLELFSVLQKKDVKAELHIYAKGEHGFDSGVDRGYSISMWRDSFIAWLKDMGFINNN
jgi:acetyl esterase/lipase